MAHYERDKDDHRVFDGGEDEDDGEGSQLPVVIIAAILVLAAFGGVVWLAYNQGVARGRGDSTPHIAMTDATKSGGDSGLKVYQERASGEDDETAAKQSPAPVANQVANQAATQPSPAPTPATPLIATPTPAPSQQAVVEPVKPAPTAPPPADVAPKPVAPVKMAQVPPKAADVAPPAAKVPAKAVTAPPSTPATTAMSTQPAIATKPPAALGIAHPAPVAVAPPPKPEVAKPAVAAPKPTKVVTGSFVLQVGAYKSEDEATAAWKGYQAKHAALLAGFGPDIQQATVGDKQWFRLRIASFADKDTATALCDRLKAQGGNCFLAH